MPLNRSEVDNYGEDYTLMRYQTLLGLLFDNPDTYFYEEEVLDYVDRLEEVLRIQLLIARVTGPTDDFPVEVNHVDGRPVYGLATHVADKHPHRDFGNIELPKGLDINQITAQLAETLEDR